MNRRHFFASTAAAAALAAPAASLAATQPKFRLRYGPHPGMFKAHAGEDIADQIQFAADQGFTGWEDNGAMGREAALQDKIGSTLAKNGMKMGVFVSHADFKTNLFVSRTDREFQDTMRGLMRKAVECAQRVGAKWHTVVPGLTNDRLDPQYQLANCITNLRAMAEVCEKAGIVMVLEPLNWYKDHPSLFLRGVPQAYAICKAVNSPSCKILDDLYHQQIDIGNLIPNLQMAWDEIAYIQVGDNPGRKEPGTGEINYRKIFEWLHKKGFTEGVVGMEHGNSIPGKEGELAVIKAYRECDSF